MMDDNSQSEATPNLEGPEVLYVQGVSNPAAVGQYPPTQAIAALILGILGLMGFSCCTAIPGVILAKSAMEVAEQHPAHPDLAMEKAAILVSWITIVINNSSAYFSAESVVGNTSGASATVASFV